MTEHTQDANVLNFVRIKSWYIPSDALCYAMLKKLGVPMLKIHADFIPTLGLLLKPKGFRAKSKNFNEIRDTFLDKLGTQWKSKDDRSCKLDDNTLVFTAVASKANKKSIAKVETLIHAFCSRWGFSCNSQFSELPKKLKLSVKYKFSSEAEPVIPNVDLPKQVSHEMILGFNKIRISVLPATEKTKVQRSSLEVFVKAGTEWVAVHTSTFTDYEIGDVTDFAAAVGTLFTRRKIREG